MFHPIHSPIASPKQFTFPHCYTPHPLCLLAADEVKAYLATRAEWKDEVSKGKMFGVLVCENEQQERGFLAAFSGTLDHRTIHSYFVPPVFNLMSPGNYFKEEESAISALNERLKQEDSEALRTERKTRSIALQRWLFAQYHLLNAHGQETEMLALFGNATPPSGTGDCCAPKLLQAAYKQGLRPVCMAEFWMGASPKDEIRVEGNFYPACSGKCKPLLQHMLQGLDVEENPLLRQITEDFTIVYEDDAVVVINKPSGMLSVPGKDSRPSVQEEMHKRYPQAEGPMIVHRLDMDTSGLMVLALTNEAYHNLQDQFLRHEVQKRYVAIVEGELPLGAKGRIDLPICPDITDRPRQMVNYEYGKRAITEYEVTDNGHGHTKLNLWPHTGRTHQLRVHLAHPLGLGTPILGDRLYGHEGKRLMLHAEELRFTHPSTNELMTFCHKAEDFYNGML